MVKTNVSQVFLLVNIDFAIVTKFHSNYFQNFDTFDLKAFNLCINILNMLSILLLKEFTTIAEKDITKNYTPNSTLNST